MKLVIEVTALDSGKKGNGDQTVSWTRLTGKNTSGSYCRAVAFGPLAERLDKEVSAHLPKGESIGATRIVVDMTGEWRDGREYERNGVKVKPRSFHIATFDILTGPVLELARLRRDGADRLALAEEHRKEGRLELAYKTVAEFAAQVCNRSLDLSDIEEALAADDDAEFGAVSEEGPDPEAAAAARYAAMDGPAEPMEIAQDQPADIAREAADGADDHLEEGATADTAEEADVLEDGDGPAPSDEAAAPAAVPAPARPAPARAGPPAGRPVAPPRRPAAPTAGGDAQADNKPDLPRATFRAPPPPRPRMPGM